MAISRHRARAVSALCALAGVAALGAGALPAAAQAAPQFNLIVNKAATPESFLGINDNGDVFGVAAESTSPLGQQAFLLKHGSSKLQFLGSPGDPTNAHSATSPQGFNNGDSVVGTSTNVNTGTQNALLWPNSPTPTNIGVRSGIVNQLANPDPTAINDGGVITGSGRAAHGFVGFTISGNHATLLPELPNGGVDSEPLAINGNGLIVGQADTNTNGSVAAEWVNGQIKALGGLPGSIDSQASAVNSSGVAVGASLDPNDLNAHAVEFVGGKVVDLGVPGTGVGDAQALSINDSGAVVGQDGFGRAFIVRNGVATDLNTLIAPGSGVTLIAAHAINRQGDIVGDAVVNATQAQVAFELTPAS
jgi:uncharacterized membrane protein